MEHSSGEKLLTLRSGDQCIGAFSFDVKSMAYPSATTYSGDLAYAFAFHANNSNSIYRDSGKVYPLSLALNFIIKA